MRDTTILPPHPYSSLTSVLIPQIMGVVTSTMCATSCASSLPPLLLPSAQVPRRRDGRISFF